MEDIISGAKTFSSYLRFQLCSKQKQVFKRDVYAQKIWGSHLKGGLEVCDALLLEHQNLPFVDVEDLETRIKNLSLQLRKELQNVDLAITFDSYVTLKTKEAFGTSDKVKVSAEDFQENVRLAVLRGSYKTCIKLLENVSPKDTVDIILGDVHILRMQLWNIYATSSNKMKKVDLIDAMTANPDPSKLLYTPQQM